MRDKKMRNELDTYEELRKSGHSEEDALKEAKFFSKPSNGNVDDLVTGKDLKIALLEFREDMTKEFNKIHLKLSSLGLKMTFVLWFLSISAGALIAKYLLHLF